MISTTSSAGDKQCHTYIKIYRIELVLIDHDKISTTPFLQIFEKIKVFQYIQIEIEFYESKSNINKTYEFI